MPSRELGGSTNRSPPIREFKEKHQGLVLNLTLPRFSVWLLYVTAELLFGDLVEAPRYWKV